MRAARLSRQHFEVYRLLVAVAFPGREHDGRPVCSWGQDKLAARLGVSTRTLQRVLADLREPGTDPRHPYVKPVGMRLGWVTVIPRERPGARRGGRLYGADRYVCNLTAAELVDLETLAGFRSSDRSDTPEGVEVEGAGRSPSSDRSDTSIAAGQTEATPDLRRSDRSDTNPSNAHRSDTSDRPVSAGQTEATPGEVSLTHSVPLGRRERGGRGDDRPSPAPSPEAPATASGGQVEDLAATVVEGEPVVPVPVDPGRETSAESGGLPDAIKQAWRDALDTDKRRLAQELADAAEKPGDRLEASA